MNDLPLFPLNSVLFPGMPLQLHIFEERYKQMMNRCIDDKTPFGVVLIETGQEAGSALAMPHLIGCTAHITQVQPLPFGRMNILALGRDRFRVHQLYQDKPYLSGDVEFIPLERDESVPTRTRALKLRHLLKQYLGTLENAGQLNFDESQLPNDSLALAYLSAVILQTDTREKQLLLAAETARDMLYDLVALYRREVTLLEFMISDKDVMDNESPFSFN
jgi:Lon protease-like protein